MNWDTAKVVKDKIQQKEGIPADQQTLIHAGKMLQDECIVAVQPDLQKLIYEGKLLNDHDIVADHDFKIIAKIENKEHISLKHQSLTYGGRWLHSEKTMADYKIQKESTLYLVIAAP
ncbi:hypothetical protein ACLOJK_030718 [Asimina triloba]